MVPLTKLLKYTDSLLESSAFDDYCPNGLQVEGRPNVLRLISAVSASQAAIDVAVERNADALLVHHGFFWRGEDARIIGMKKRRIDTLLRHGISLIAYHLPLDAHASLGNNARLGALLGFETCGRFGAGGIGFIGRPGETSNAKELAAKIQRLIGRSIIHVKGGSEIIATIGWCTGAAQGFIKDAADLELDAYLSGEISEQTTHVARECGLHYFAVGHHASERYGVRSLGTHLAEQFHLEHQFVDIDNPA
jgi:dinuclear metal center YbgI/SA1388 family protein